MATWAIGDVQGCFETLRRLLARIGGPPPGDRIILVGDLVNRGPRSLEVLRWAADAGERVEAVLGNHDIHLLARAVGVVGAAPRDTLDEVLDAPDRDALLGWLLARPLLLHAVEAVVVHAGLLPSWTAAKAECLAREAEAELRGPSARRALAMIHGHHAGSEHILAARVLTRIRYCDAGGQPAWKASEPPGQAQRGFVPWFEVPGRKSKGTPVVFGHWAALGLLLRKDVTCLDAGCVWGGSLAALRLEDRRLVQEPQAEAPVPWHAGFSKA
jgi:bis(5'-nucleosyl)-tetraphosphatase (symmetrical)